jgi:hypothetical protein
VKGAWVGSAEARRFDVTDPSKARIIASSHQGIRCPRKGSNRIETAGTMHSCGPLEPWFESGPEPVFVATSGTSPAPPT